MTVHDDFSLPHGGVKRSGFGRFNANFGVEEFLRPKTITWADWAKLAPRKSKGYYCQNHRQVCFTEWRLRSANMTALCRNANVVDEETVLTRLQLSGAAWGSVEGFRICGSKETLDQLSFDPLSFDPFLRLSILHLYYIYMKDSKPRQFFFKIFLKKKRP